MQQFVPLKPGKYYHIYNHGINGCDLFHSSANYEYFLRLYSKHVDPVADSYAWCLMRNHFHMLIRVKDDQSYQIDFTDPNQLLLNIDYVSRKMSKAFSNLFNAYAQAFNKANKRTGGLFETPFKRIEVTSEQYFKHLVYYIHHNPVKHGFTEMMIDYPWSSYLSIISLHPTNLKRDELIGWFNNLGEFQQFHSNGLDLKIIQPFLLE